MRKILLLFGLILLALTASNMVLRQKPSEAYWILFNSYQPQNEPNSLFEFYRINPDGSNPQKILTSNLLIRQPVWSPDGEWFISWIAPENDSGGLYKIAPNGDILQQVVPLEDRPHQPALSPDGKWITYIDMQEDSINLMMAHSDGTQPRQLTYVDQNVFNFKWSPQGDWIVFDVWKNYRRMGYRIRPDGSDLEPITPEINVINEFKWSPDGQWIAIRSETAIYLVRPDGADFRDAIDTQSVVTSLSWSPDSQHLVADTSPAYTDIFTIDINSLNVRSYDLQPVLNRVPIWSPDGKWIIHSALYVVDDPQNGLYRVSRDGTTSEKLADVNSVADVPSVSPFIDLPVHTSRLFAFSVGMLMVSVLPIRRFWDKHS